MKKLAILIAAVLVAIGSFAEKGAIVLTSPLQFQLNAVSPNGKWACGIIGDGTYTMLQGLLWNLETNETTYLSTIDESAAYDVTDDGLVVGAYTDYEITGTGVGSKVPGYYKDGKWTRVDNSTIEGVVETTGEIYAVSADGSVMVGWVQNGPADYKIAPAKWVDGKLVKLLPYVGAGVAYAVTEDGKYAAGWSYKEGDGNRNVALWRDDESVEYLSEFSSWVEEGRKFSPDGTKLLCNSFGHKFIYDLTTNTKTELPWINPACWSQLMSYIDNNGLVLGGEEFQDENTGASGRYAYVYESTTGKAVTFDEWLKNTHNVEIDKNAHMIFRGVDMSNDGKVIALLDYPMENGVPVGEHASMVLLLDREVTYCEPVALRAEKLTGLNSVRITWNLPLMNAENVLGYNLYRDGQAIAEGITEMAYIDANLAEGSYTYTVTAIYEGENDDFVESGLSVAAVVTVTEDELNRAQNIQTHGVNYNDMKLRWNAPESNLPSSTYFDLNSPVAGFGGGLNSFAVATRLPYDIVNNYAGVYHIARVGFYPRNIEAVYTLKVYINGVEKVSQTVDAAIIRYNDMNIIDLDTPVAVAVNDDVMIAVEVDASKFTATSNDVVGVNYGNVVTGFSDLLRLLTEPEFYSLNQSSIDAGYGEMPVSWGITAVFAQVGEDGKADVSNDIVAGYDIYRDGAKVGSTIETNFLDTDLTEGTVEYGVVAKYANGREAQAETLEIAFAPKAEALRPINDVHVCADVDLVETRWEAPLNNDATIISYSSAPSSGRGMSLGGATDLIEYTVAHDYTYSYLEWYEGYYINAIRFYPSAEATFVVALEANGTDLDFIVLNQEGEEGGYTLNTWNTVKLTTPIRIEPNTNYRVKVICSDVDPTTYPICMDKGVGEIALTDLYSWDYSNFSSAISDGGLTGSWMIGMEISNDNTELLPVKGYNVLVDGDQVNNELITTTSYTHEGFAWSDGSTHRLRVNVVYDVDGGVEVQGNQVIFHAQAGVENITIDRVKVYPNPATSYIAVDGESDKLVLVDMAGRMVAQTSADRLDVNSVAVGNYLLNIYRNGTVETVKVVIVR